MTEFKTLEELATNLISKKSKSSLIYAFNGSGKTRLSMAVKEKLDSDERGQIQNLGIDEKKIFYFNAFTEDLFSWDNDLQDDLDRKLKINLESTFLKYILFVQGKEHEIIDLFQYYLGIFPEGNVLRSKQQIILPSFHDNFTTVKFSKTYTAKNEHGEDERITEDNIKISKGEENSFIWSIFFTFLNQVIESKNTQDSFQNLEYIFIDDPVSSLDDRKIIEMAVDLASLIKESEFTQTTETVHESSGLKFIITTHHPLFFNVLFNELKGDSCSRFVLEHKLDLTTGDETYHLKETSDSPFAYHLKVIDIIDEAIKENRLEKYHYNLLRSLFEKTSTFLGYKSWEEIIPESEKEKVHRRYLHLFSHDKQSAEEFPNITEDDKEQFKVIYKEFIKKYYFNKDISHLY
ncbi:anticodon nuclease [Streptococcus timonensis]|uniref:anticodon nuclease n=1 Tax=Streptococcus timonensis TaxID=1852387 RepID=UPI0039C27026